MSTATKERDALGAVAHELGELTAMIEEQGGDVTDDLLLGAFERLEGDFRSRVDRLLEYRASLLANATAIAARERMLADLRQTYQRGAERIERALLTAMVTSGEELIEGEFGRARLHPSRARVELDDGLPVPLEKTPARWKRYKVARTLTGIEFEAEKEALERAGVKMAGIELDKKMAMTEIQALDGVPEANTFRFERKGMLGQHRVPYLEDGEETGVVVVRDWQLEVK